MPETRVSLRERLRARSKTPVEAPVPHVTFSRDVEDQIKGSEEFIQTLDPVAKEVLGRRLTEIRTGVRPAEDYLRAIQTLARHTGRAAGHQYQADVRSALEGAEVTESSPERLGQRLQDIQAGRPSAALPPPTTRPITREEIEERVRGATGLLLKDPRAAASELDRLREEARGRGRRTYGEAAADTVAAFGRGVTMIPDVVGEIPYLPKRGLEQLETAYNVPRGPGEPTDIQKQAADVREGLGRVAQGAGTAVDLLSYSIPGVGQARLQAQLTSLGVRTADDLLGLAGFGTGKSNFDKPGQEGLKAKAVEALWTGLMLGGGTIGKALGGRLKGVAPRVSKFLLSHSDKLPTAILAGGQVKENQEIYNRVLEETGSPEKAFRARLDHAVASAIGLYAGHKIRKSTETGPDKAGVFGELAGEKRAIKSRAKHFFRWPRRSALRDEAVAAGKREQMREDVRGLEGFRKRDLEIIPRKIQKVSGRKLKGQSQQMAIEKRAREITREAIRRAAPMWQQGEGERKLRFDKSKFARDTYQQALKQAAEEIRGVKRPTFKPSPADFLPGKATGARPTASRADVAARQARGKRARAQQAQPIKPEPGHEPVPVGDIPPLHRPVAVGKIPEEFRHVPTPVEGVVAPSQKKAPKKQKAAPKQQQTKLETPAPKPEPKVEFQIETPPPAPPTKAPAKPAPKKVSSGEKKADVAKALELKKKGQLTESDIAFLRTAREKYKGDKFAETASKILREKGVVDRPKAKKPPVPKADVADEEVSPFADPDLVLEVEKGKVKQQKIKDTMRKDWYQSGEERTASAARKRIRFLANQPAGENTAERIAEIERIAVESRGGGVSKVADAAIEQIRQETPKPQGAPSEAPIPRGGVKTDIGFMMPERKPTAKKAPRPPRIIKNEPKARKPKGYEGMSRPELADELRARGLGAASRDSKARLIEKLNADDLESSGPPGSVRGPGHMGGVPGLVGESSAGIHAGSVGKRLETIKNIESRASANNIPQSQLEKLAKQASHGRAVDPRMLQGGEVRRLGKLVSDMIAGPEGMGKKPSKAHMERIASIRTAQRRLRIDEPFFRELVREVTNGKTDSTRDLSRRQVDQLVGRMKYEAGQKGGIAPPGETFRKVSPEREKVFRQDSITAQQELRNKNAKVKYTVAGGDASPETIKQMAKQSGVFQTFVSQQSNPETVVRTLFGPKSQSKKVLLDDLLVKGVDRIKEVSVALEQAKMAVKKAGITPKEMKSYMEKPVKVKLSSGRTLNRTPDEYAFIALAGQDPHIRHEMVRYGIATQKRPKPTLLTGSDLAEIEGWVRKNTKLDNLRSWFYIWANSQGAEMAREAMWDLAGRNFEVHGNYVPHGHLSYRAREQSARLRSEEGLAAQYRAAASGRKPRTRGRPGSKIFAEEPRLEEQSPFKPRSVSHDPVRIDGLFDSIYTHVNRLSTAKHLGRPVQRALGLLDSAALNRSISRRIADGPQILRRLKDHIRAFEGLEEINMTPTERWFSKRLRPYQTAILGLKPQIGLMQGISLLNASSIIPLRHITSAMWKRTPNLMENIKKYSPDIYARLNNKTPLFMSPALTPERRQMVREAFGAPAPLTSRAAYSMIRYVDGWTIRRIYQAAYNEAQAKGLKGESMHRFAAQRAQEVVNRSQPTTNPLTISSNALYGRKSPALKFFGMFSSQPNKSYNQALQAVDAYRSGEMKLSRMIREVTVPLVINSALAYAVGKGARRLYGYKSDDTLLDHTLNTVERGIGGLVYTRDIFKKVRKAMQGKTWASTSDEPSNLLKTITELSELIQNLAGDERYLKGDKAGERKATATAIRALIAALTAAGRITGTPVEGPIQLVKPRLP